MIYSGIRIFLIVAAFAAMVFIVGCTENIRDESVDAIAAQVEHVSTPDHQGLTWFAPVLMVSKYRTLFYGYNTLSYRLAASESAGTASGISRRPVAFRAAAAGSKVLTFARDFL